MFGAFFIVRNVHFLLTEKPSIVIMLIGFMHLN